MSVVIFLALGLAGVWTGIRAHTLLADMRRVRLRSIRRVSSQARTDFYQPAFTHDSENKLMANPVCMLRSTLRPGEKHAALGIMF